MTTKEFKAAIQDRKIVTLEYEWDFYRDAFGFRASHNDNVDKWERFETIEELTRYFSIKRSYFKARLKLKKIDRPVFIINNLTLK